MDHLLSDFGYAGLFLWIFVEQLGIPVPVFPILVAAGTLVASGRLEFGRCLGSVIVASLVADLFWYCVGRMKGPGILHLVCRLSWKPNSCILSTKGAIMRYGAQALLFAKFVPGLNTLVTPLAGAVGIPLRRFVAYDLAGAVIWGVIPLLLGMELHRLLPTPNWGAFVRAHLWGLAATAVALVLVYKFVRRRLYVRALKRELKGALTVAELKEKMERGDDFVLLDIRHPYNVNFRPVQIPGALHIGLQEVDRRLPEIPLDRPLVVYCDCPQDQAAFMVARDLRRAGAASVRVLRGGLSEWEKHGFATARSPDSAGLPTVVAPTIVSEAS